MAATAGGDDDVTVMYMADIIESLRNQFDLMPTAVVAALLEHTTMPADKARWLAAERPDLGLVAGFSDMRAWTKYRDRVGRSTLIAGVTVDADVLAEASADNRHQVASAAAANPHCTAELLQEMWDRTTSVWPFVAGPVAGHPNISAALATHIAECAAIKFRTQLAGNPALPADVAVLLAADTVTAVRAALAANLSVDATVFAGCKVTDTAAFARLATHRFGDNAELWIAAAKIAQGSTQTCGDILDVVELTFAPAI